MAPPPGVGAPSPDSLLENRGPTLIAATSAMSALGLVFVIARIYCRLISIRRLVVEDYIAILTTVLLISNVAILAVAVHYGVGRHIAALSPKDISRAIFFTAVSSGSVIFSFALPKLAVTILLARLLSPGRWHRVAMWAVAILYLAMSAITVVLVWVQCTPVAAQWGAVKGTCWAPQVMFTWTMVHGIFGVMIDLYLAVYPSIKMMTLSRLNWKKKLALSSALGFGYCAGGIAAVKCYSLHNLYILRDFTYSMSNLLLWANIEGNCVLIGACIPCLHPLVRKIFGAKALDCRAHHHHHEQQDAIATIGSHPKDRKRVRRPLSSLGPDTSNFTEETGGENLEDWKYTTLRECSTAGSAATANTAGEWATEAIASLQQQQQRLQRTGTPPV